MSNHGPQSMAWGARANAPEHDFYETPETAVSKLSQIVKLTGDCLEPGNGMDSIGRVLPKGTLKMDIDPTKIADIYANFMTHDFGNRRFDLVVTNPPFNQNGYGEWITRCIGLLKPEGKCVAFLKLLFLEGKKRREFFKNFPPSEVNIFTERQVINGGCGICYAWFVWERGFNGQPIIKWI